MKDLQEIRSLFPIFQTKVNGKKLVYFDNGATTQKPISVINSIENYYAHVNSNVHRGVHYLSNLATDKLETVRCGVQKFLNAKFEHEIIFTKGTTDAINLVAQCLKRDLDENSEIIISELEHHSNIVPWQLACEEVGAKIKVIPLKENGELDWSVFEKLLSNKTKLVAISHVSNGLGTINPIKYVIDNAKKFNAKVLIDGAQAASHIPVNVQKLDVDFYCFSGHKVFGPTGVGVLYGKETVLNSMPPYQGGGEMIKNVSFKKTTFAGLPHKFEAGTPNIAGIIGLGAALDFINKIGLNKIFEHEINLTEYATKELLKIKGLKIYGTAQKKSAIISFNVDKLHHYDIGVLLDKMGVAVRTGHHCNQPIMEKYNIEGTVRISLAFYNTKEEIDCCVDAIKKSIKMLS